MVKEFLSQKGIGFKEHDVSRDRAAAQELVDRTDQMGVPVTVIDGKIIIGFDRARLEQALNMEQQRERPSFGAAIADASKITARQGLGITLGAYVGNVRPGSVAQRVGLVPGDIIIEINMQRVATADDLEQALSKISGGGRISLVFLRGNKTFTTEGTL
ncbi:hypothetical protein ES703_71767 [subsurface metagenome]|jgi:S1-C subfamily serine protease